MKTPDLIKKGLKCRKHGYAETCNRNCQDCTMFIPNYSISERYSDALAYIQQLESTYSQVSKALCDKENATLDEMLDAVDQLTARIEVLEFGEQLARQREEETGAILKETRSELEQIRRERDAAVEDLEDSADCEYCEHEPIFHTCPETNCHACERDCPCARCSFRQKDGFKWRGPCPENTKEDADV